jgi:hypothetical protein
MPEPSPASPLVFAIEVVMTLVLAATAAAIFLGLPAERRRRQGRAALSGHVDHQRDLALSLGLALRTWLMLRLLCAGGGVVAGFLTGMPVLAVAGAGVGMFGLPWLLAGRAAQRRLDMERALAALVVEVRELMRQSNLALDRALREAARSPQPQLRDVVAPLMLDLPVADCLAEVAHRARSPLADLIVTAFLIARTHNPVALVRVTDEVLQPLLEVSVGLQEENQATIAQQRAAALVIGLIMAVLFAALMRVPSMQAFYTSAAGQVVLLGVFAMYLGLVWLIGQVARPMRWIAWDIDRVRRETEALIG